MRSRIHLVIVGAVILVAAACGNSNDEQATTSLTPLEESTRNDLDDLFESLEDEPDIAALERLAEVGDPRLGWLFADLLRFIAPTTPLGQAAVVAWEANTGVDVPADEQVWRYTTDQLIAADTPAPPTYVRWKSQVFELIEPGWAPFFADGEATIDWRWISWGGVLIDDRPIHQTDLGCPRGCIPALDDPGLVSAGTEADWLADDRLIFGVAVGDEAVALPKNMMEVHEMVNMTIGGRRVAIPYCTLCGSAQAYFTDSVPDGVALGDAETFEMRTSGLLSRSNKVMFELHTMSVFDTFTGRAVTGPLRERGVELEQLSVATSTWGAWKQDHPESLLLASDGGIGRSYAADPLRGRDDDGPIFPIGDVDPRLPVQEPVVGVIQNDGTAVAFPAAEARSVIANGSTVVLGAVALTAAGDGFTAVDTDSGEEYATHEAFWFAWSQFHPDTELWRP